MVFKVDNVPDLSMPVSISALRVEGSPSIIQNFEWEKYAVEIIRTTILWLIALERIRVLKASIGRSILSLRIQKYTGYLLEVRIDESASHSGWLEGEILTSIALRDSHRISDTIFPGAFIDKVIWSLIGSYQTFPYHHVVHSVQIDAQNGGWGISQGFASPQFQPAPDRLAELIREQEKARSLVENFVGEYPDFNRVLTTQIRKGLRSRLRIQTWDNV
jgi:hypothetical protein